MKYQSSENAIQVCDSSTGHSVKNVAFCYSAAIAKDLASKADDAAIFARKALEKASR